MLRTKARYFAGTKLQELRWRLRGVSDLQTSLALADPHRPFLVDRIGRFAPLESVLEIGCHAGQNLVALSRQYPGIHCCGVDISRRAINVARRELLQEALDGEVFVGRADDLHRFPDNSYDVVLTDATLMYVGPDKIDRAVSELIRVARRGLILIEFNLFESDDGSKHSSRDGSGWTHDYAFLMAGLAGVEQVCVERLPYGLFRGGGSWEKYGALVEVELKARGGVDESDN